MMHDWQGWLYVAAVLIPLAAFVVELLFIRLLGRLNAYLATGAIATSFVLSLVGFVSYVSSAPEILAAEHHGGAHAVADENPGGGDHPPEAAPPREPGRPLVWTGSWDWLSLGRGLSATPLRIPIGIAIDNLAAIMFVMVTLIATLVHIYSMGYMHDDPRYPRFFAYLSLFCFSMLGLLASASIFMVFVFWELVGLCSYLLIGFWYEDKANADAANKAFIVNRVGDVGMLIGLGILWSYFGTFTIADINHELADAALRDPTLHRISRASVGEQVTLDLADTTADGRPTRPRTIPYWLLTLAGLGIFAGCVGKSAQFPLHVWLPDAMAGPTPVSALIHAATMVAAGVYLVGRFFPLFTAETLLVIGYTGGITLFIAASIAMVQTDYKKVLAYSTVSQLGFMMLALGVGGWSAGLFHLLTHAFFKALLFLGAGSIFHAVHTYHMPALGGLLKKMPITGWTMLAATMAISGVPLFSGFYSKDAIMGASLFFARQEPQHVLLFVLPAVGAMMTAFYMFRMWFLVFAGEPRGFPATAHEPAAAHGHGHGHHDPNPAAHAHESGPLMAWPLLALAVPTVILGWPWRLGSAFILPIGEPLVEAMLAYGAPVDAIELGDSHYWAMGASILIAAIGIGLGVLYYGPWPLWKRLSAEQSARRFGPAYAFLVHKWRFDELYDTILVRPTLALAELAATIDRRVIDGLINGAAARTVRLSDFNGIFDRLAIDGLVNFIARAIYLLGDWGRGLQTGRLRSYLTVLAVAVVGLFAGIIFWIR